MDSGRAYVAEILKVSLKEYEERWDYSHKKLHEKRDELRLMERSNDFLAKRVRALRQAITELEGQ